MKPRFLYLIGALVIVLSLIFVFAMNPVKRLHKRDIESMVLYSPPSAEEGITMDDDAIATFINAFNATNTFRDDHCTTHDHMVVIHQKNGEIMKVYGGTQGFQTVICCHKQFNIRGLRLQEFFKTYEASLSNK